MQESLEHPLERWDCLVSDESHRKYRTLQVVIHPNEHAQRHVKLVGFVSCVECDTVSEIFIGTPAACVCLEDILHTVIGIFVVVIEEFRIYLLHIIKESQQLLHIVLSFLLRELVLPAV